MTRKSSVFITLLGLTLASLSGLSRAGIEGSKHDFSQTEWSKGDTCGACHSPESNKPPAAAPLWDPTANLKRTFGSSLKDSKSAGEGTRMCIRCHDGSIAKDFTPTPFTNRVVNINNPGIFGTGHGASNHPVGVEYPQMDRRFKAASSVTAPGRVVLPDGKVECISCHDPHDQSGLPHMLVTSNARSNLCLSCHRK